MTPLLLGAAGPSPLWYLTRGTGLVALVLLTASVVLGIVSTSRFAPRGWPRFATQGLHRNISLLVLVLLAIHIATAEADTYAPVGWAAVVVPFVSSYRPLWLGLGTLAFDLLLALVVTSLLRARIGYATWRAIHWLAYLSWPVALVHGLGTGTDTRLGWVLALDAVCVGAVVIAGGWRLTQGWPAGARTRLVSGTAGAIGLMVIAVWVVTGPLRPGWAKRAGTPPRLLAGATRPLPTTGGSPGGTATSPAPGMPAPPFSARLSGTLTQTGQAGDRVVVHLDTTLSQGAAGTLAITLRGRAADGGVALSSSTVTLGPPGSPGLYRGQVVSLSGERLVASVRAASGAALDLAVAVHLDPASGTVQGTLRGQAPGSAGGEGGDGGG
ncbi:MAG TPA: ferric reductase-like transmembrane domain-containing protein [Acidimicrobiales bacterium]|nr:ferric reductase-like transmembrane domain-containing protein [Acidimicrobiales bacterium]